jgi:hypothetical protein
MIHTLPYDLTEMRRRSVMLVSVVVFAEQHSLRVLAVLLVKSWCKYHLSDVTGKCTDQSAGHQWHQTTSLRKSDVVVAFDSSTRIIRSHKREFLVKQYLNHKFSNRWIGRGGARNWPPRSPYLKPTRLPCVGLHEGYDVCTQVEHERRTTPANSQRCKKHQQRCSTS